MRIEDLLEDAPLSTQLDIFQRCLPAEYTFTKIWQKDDHTCTCRVSKKSAGKVDVKIVPAYREDYYWGFIPLMYWTVSECGGYKKTHPPVVTYSMDEMVNKIKEFLGSCDVVTNPKRRPKVDINPYQFNEVIPKAYVKTLHHGQAKDIPVNITVHQREGSVVEAAVIDAVCLDGRVLDKTSIMEPDKEVWLLMWILVNAAKGGGLGPKGFRIIYDGEVWYPVRVMNSAKSLWITNSAIGDYSDWHNLLDTHDKAFLDKVIAQHMEENQNVQEK